MRTTLMLISLTGMIVVLMSILIALTPGKRYHRIGITMLLVWAYWGLGIYGLRAIGDPLPTSYWFTWWGPSGIGLAAWALWDVSRLARVYGTTTLERAADMARGFLHSKDTADATWTAWAQGLPRAAWVKGQDGIMLAINRRYEIEYGAEAAGYVGSEDREQWGEKIAAQFGEHDKHVFEVGHPIVVKEAAPHWDDPSRTAMFLKFPVRNKRGQVVGVGGVELVQPSKAKDEQDSARMGCAA